MDLFIKIKSMHQFTLQNVVWKEEKHYVAQCLNVDVSSFGPTKDEALKNLDEALALYFEDVNNPTRNFQIYPQTS